MTIQVRGPDGQIIRFPDGTDQQTIHNVMSAHYSTKSPQRAAPPPGPADKPKSFWQGVVEGALPYGANAGRIIAMVNPLTAVADLASKVTGIKEISPTNAVNQVQAAGNRTLANSPYQGSGTGKFVGGVIGSAPAAFLPGSFAAQGAASGALGADLNDPANLALNTAFGALAGKVGERIAPPLARATGAVASKVANLVAPARNTQVLPPIEQAFGRAALARAGRFNALGVADPTTGVITRDPAAYSAEINLAKTEAGSGLAQQMRDMEATLVEKGRQLVRGAGGAKGAEATGSSLQDVLDAKRGEMQRLTGKLYDQVRETQGNNPVGSLEGLRGMLDHPDMVDNATYDSMRGSLIKRLQRIGLADAKGAPIEGATATVKQAEDLRKFIRTLGSDSPTVFRARNELIDALDGDVVNAVGSDAFKAARDSAKARFVEFSKTLAGRIADERIPAEKLTTRLLGSSIKDIRSIRQSLHTGTEEQIARGTQAWQDLRAQALSDLMGTSVDADGRLVGSRLSSEFGKQAEKLREILDPASYKELRRLALATRDLKSYPQGHSVNTSNTATTLANMFANVKPAVRDGWFKFFAKHGVTAIASAPLGAFPYANVALGAGSRVAESAAERRVANALANQIRLARSPAEAAAAVAKLQEAAQSSAAAQKALDYLTRAGLLAGSAAAQPVVQSITGN